ncbi:transposase [Advenella sp. WQ 585]|jgi:transposase|uniref:Transposase n=1 Tax=Advenella mandrilli TaxID=2800330 RepID=A0ABS1EHY9_9BURK|nr:transposase [Advenella mandrilli]MBK1782627.1 transposase [Advenella mandrilli]
MNDIMPLKPVRRSYSADFKAELVKASQQPGVSLAGLALRHGLNANLLRRWVREHEREGKHLATQSDTAMPFVAVSLPAPVSSHSCQLQMQGKDLQVTLSVPLHQLEQCSGLLLRLLR